MLRSCPTRVCFFWRRACLRQKCSCKRLITNPISYWLAFMSWQEYVDKNLVGAGVAARAAIVGIDGNLYASSQSLSVSLRNLAPFDVFSSVKPR
jgi:hypothetical protein